MTTQAQFPDRRGTALLIVDMQERLILAMPEKRREQMLRNTSILIQAARRLGLPILMSEQYPKGLGPTVPEVRGLIPDVEPIEKMVFSCAGEARFREAAEAAGASAFILAGIENHVCVLQTALDLAAAGNRVFTARDATCSRTKMNWRAGNEVMAAAGVTVSSTEILVFQLLRSASAEEFKEISKLVR